MDHNEIVSEIASKTEKVIYNKAALNSAIKSKRESESIILEKAVLSILPAFDILSNNMYYYTYWLYVPWLDRSYDTSSIIKNPIFDMYNNNVKGIEILTHQHANVLWLCSDGYFIITKLQKDRFEQSDCIKEFKTCEVLDSGFSISEILNGLNNKLQQQLNGNMIKRTKEIIEQAEKLQAIVRLI